jgi:hypothetical protein
MQTVVGAAARHAGQHLEECDSTIPSASRGRQDRRHFRAISGLENLAASRR